MWYLNGAVGWTPVKSVQTAGALVRLVKLLLCNELMCMGGNTIVGANIS